MSKTVIDDNSIGAIADNAINYIKEEIHYHLWNKFVNKFVDSQIYSWQRVINPFCDRVTEYGVDAFTYLEESPVLMTSFLTISRIHYSYNVKDTIRRILQDFDARYTEVRNIHDDQVDKLAAMLFFVIFLHEWITFHPDVKGSADLDMWYSALEKEIAMDLIALVFVICTDSSDSSASCEDIVVELYDNVLSEIMVKGTYGTVIKSIRTQENGEVPF